MTRFFYSLTIICAWLMAGSRMQAQDIIQLTEQEVASMYQNTSRSAVSVHDPSVVHSSGRTYYIIGSHRGWARSTDNMVNWSGVDNSNLFGIIGTNGNVQVASYADAFLKNETKTVPILKNGQVTEVAFGNFDAKAWAHADQEDWTIDGNMWAPDLLYNPNSGKWMMYMSVNGDRWHSVIVLLTADRITGPYVYQGPVTYSGFINTTTPEINWKKTDLELVIGEQTTLPARYNRGGDWGTYWPNDIDPCVFFDESGELWMSYGSWSGGIFLLKMDKQTGLRDYTVTYPVENDGQGRALSDPYFGKRIAGGYYSSGEGSYIQHIGNYYYLFMSYGGFAPDGGYEMRVFRSSTPEGPYLDASNRDACFHNRYWQTVGPGAQTDGGVKLLGAYNGWGFQTVGECAQGHNSAIVDDEGRSFVIYHTKFNNGTIFHQVRTRQLFLNKNGWLCAAPFQFDGETDTDASLAAGCRFTKEQIAGTYDVLIHRYRLDHENMEEVTPIQLTLNSNGTITGALTGSWSMTDGTAYISVKAGSVTYDGVIVEQTIDETTIKAICFTGVATSGVSIWGWKMEPQYAIAYTAQHYTVPVKDNGYISSNIPLFGTGSYGATIEWESSVPEVVSNTGLYNPADTITPLILTCRITAENYSYERTYRMKARAASTPSGDCRTGIVAYYNFDEKPTQNLYDESQKVVYTKVGSGTASVLETDLNRMGQVVHVFAGNQKNASCARFTNPLQGRTDLDGFTLSAWVLRNDDDLWGSLWTITDKAGTLSTVKQRLFLTGNAYIGFDDGTNQFAINEPNESGSNATNYIASKEWTLVTVTVSKTDGVTLYINGSRKAHKSFTSSAGTASSASAAAQLFDYQAVLDFITTAGYIQFGAGTQWGSADACYDDLLIYDRVLTASDVRALNTLSNRVTDFGPEKILMGDVNGDGTIDLTDAIMIVYYSLGQQPEGFIEKAADMNGDGAIDLTDGIIVVYKSLGAE